MYLSQYGKDLKVQHFNPMLVTGIIPDDFTKYRALIVTLGAHSALSCGYPPPKKLEETLELLGELFEFTPTVEGVEAALNKLQTSQEAQ